jgi:type IV secretory pathway VirB2 component (pilin)
MGILLIMLLHGVPVYFLGVMAKSKSVLAVVAVISAFLGLVMGASQYFGADLFAVVVAYILAASQISNTQSNSRCESSSPDLPTMAREEHKQRARSKRYL